eukprot:TRINITY_DN2129_c0_g1_i2.p1 TRINITY_DN2129_c0_g1~~TRINITY_DN2129_c0_g1_i2.p1  ORF type:complete len:1022 (+),score=187.95 TRINITY_DN2129_c0_g1_i2:93-3158(+)
MVLELKIVDSEVINANTYYHVSVEVDSEQWVIKRRFKHFEALHADLRKGKPGAKALKTAALPPKGMFGFRHRMGIGNFNEDRLNGLQGYLRQLAVQVESMSESEPLQRFLTREASENRESRDDLSLTSSVHEEAGRRGQPSTSGDTGPPTEDSPARQELAQIREEHVEKTGLEDVGHFIEALSPAPAEENDVRAGSSADFDSPQARLSMPPTSERVQESWCSDDITVHQVMTEHTISAQDARDEAPRSRQSTADEVHVEKQPSLPVSFTSPVDEPEQAQRSRQSTADEVHVERQPSLPSSFTSPVDEPAQGTADVAATTKPAGGLSSLKAKFRANLAKGLKDGSLETVARQADALGEEKEAVDKVGAIEAPRSRQSTADEVQMEKQHSLPTSSTSPVEEPVQAPRSRQSTADEVQMEKQHSLPTSSTSPVEEPVQAPRSRQSTADEVQVEKQHSRSASFTSPVEEPVQAARSRQSTAEQAVLEAARSRQATADQAVLEVFAPFVKAPSQDDILVDVPLQDERPECVAPVEKAPSDTNTSDIEAMVKELRTNFRAGVTRSINWRRTQLMSLHRMFVENHEAISEAVTRDLGGSKLRGVAEWASALDAEQAVRNLNEWSKPTVVGGCFNRRYVFHEPKGVVLNIAPWNYPFNMCFQPLVGALAAGNCVVIKPSEMTPACSALVHSLVKRYLDSRCIRVVQGGVPETTALLAQRFDHIFFTGGGRIGRVVMKAAAMNLTPVTLECGGKSPVIVDSSAKLEIACKSIAVAKWMNCGQTCIAPDYVLVHEKIAERFLNRIVELTAKAYGENADAKSSSEWGKVVNELHVDRLRYLIETSGGIVVSGCVECIDRPARFVPPTVIQEPDPNSAIMREEIFGPILPILKFKDLDQALRIMNKVSGNAPLASYMFSYSKANINKVLASASSGGTCVNAAFEQILDPNLPFGGKGESGIGSYHGKHGFDEFSHHRAVFWKTTSACCGGAAVPLPDRKKPIPATIYSILVKVKLTGFLPKCFQGIAKAICPC